MNEAQLEQVVTIYEDVVTRRTLAITRGDAFHGEFGTVGGIISSGISTNGNQGKVPYEDPTRVWKDYRKVERAFEGRGFKPIWRGRPAFG